MLTVLNTIDVPRACIYGVVYACMFSLGGAMNPPHNSERIFANLGAIFGLALGLLDPITALPKTKLVNVIGCSLLLAMASITMVLLRLSLPTAIGASFATFVMGSKLYY